MFARREAVRLGEVTESLFSRALSMFHANDRSQIVNLIDSDREINSRNRAIHTFLSEARRHIESPEQEMALDRILHFSTTMENIGDIIAHNLSRLAIKRLDRGVKFSNDGLEEIERIHSKIRALLELEINRFLSDDTHSLPLAEQYRLEIKDLCNQSIRHHRRRLSDRKNASIGTSSIHQDMIRDFSQIANLLEPA